MSSLSNNPSMPWKNGYYKSRTYHHFIRFVNEDSVIRHSISGKPTQNDDPMSKETWTYGDFGQACPDVIRESGITQYNVEMCVPFSDKIHATLNDSGNVLTFYGMDHIVHVLEWINNAAFMELRNTGDPAEALPNPYKIQPGSQGEFLWISGPPGAGKSSSGLLLSRNANYVYYEADAFMFHLNPYVPSNVEEPIKAIVKQNFLRNVSQERIDAVANGINSLKDLVQGKVYDFEKISEFYASMCKDITKERKRIGGDWVVAHAVHSRKVRDLIRKQLGTDVIFVVLDMDKEDQMSRIRSRHGENTKIIEYLDKVYDAYETADDDEPNAINVVVTKDMSREDVVDKIILLVNAYKRKPQK